MTRRACRTGSPYQKWDAAEVAALKAGVAKHGLSNWEKIRMDSDPESAVLRERTGEQLKDKWRNMVKHGQLTTGAHHSEMQPKTLARPWHKKSTATASASEHRLAAAGAAAAAAAAAAPARRSPAVPSATAAPWATAGITCSAGRAQQQQQQVAGSDQEADMLQQDGERKFSHSVKRSAVEVIELEQDDDDSSETVGNSKLRGAGVHKRRRPNSGSERPSRPAEDRRYGSYDPRRYGYGGSPDQVEPGQQLGRLTPSRSPTLNPAVVDDDDSAAAAAAVGVAAHSTPVQEEHQSTAAAAAAAAAAADRPGEVLFCPEIGSSGGNWRSVGGTAQTTKSAQIETVDLVAGSAISKQVLQHGLQHMQRAAAGAVSGFDLQALRQSTHTSSIVVAGTLPGLAPPEPTAGLSSAPPTGGSSESGRQKPGFMAAAAALQQLAAKTGSLLLNRPWKKNSSNSAAADEVPQGYLALALNTAAGTTTSPEDLQQCLQHMQRAAAAAVSGFDLQALRQRTQAAEPSSNAVAGTLPGLAPPEPTAGLSSAPPTGGSSESERQKIGLMGEFFLHHMLKRTLPGFDDQCWRSGNRVHAGLAAPAEEPPYDFVYCDVSGNLCGVPGVTCYIECKSTAYSALEGRQARPISITTREWELAQNLHRQGTAKYVIFRIEHVQTGRQPRIAAVLVDPLKLLFEGNMCVTGLDLQLYGFPVAQGGIAAGAQHRDT